MPASDSRAVSRALPGLVLGAVLIGLAPIFVRLSGVGPTTAAFWRMFLALPALFLLCRLPRRAEVPRAAARSPYPWLAGLAFAGDLAVWHQSIRLTSVANSTLLANLAPVFLTLVLHFGLRQRHAPRFWSGLVLAVGGAVVLLAGSLRVGPQTALGDVCAIVTAMFYAAYQLLVSYSRRGLSAPQVMLRSSAVASAVLLGIALAAGESLRPPDLHAWLILAGLALVSHVGGQGLVAWALAHLPASFSSVTLLVQPVAATVFAWLILGEGFGLQQLAGGIIVMAGILVCRFSMPELPAAPAAPRAAG